MTEPPEPAAMHLDESLPAARPPMSGSSANPGIKLPPPAWTKGQATPGGVPPMFASPGEQRPELRADRLES